MRYRVNESAIPPVPMSSSKDSWEFPGQSPWRVSVLVGLTEQITSTDIFSFYDLTVRISTQEGFQM